MIKNRCKKIVSAMLLITISATIFNTSVFAGGCLSRTNGYGNISPDTLLSIFPKYGKCGGDVKYSFKGSTGELTFSGVGDFLMAMPGMIIEIE